MLNFDFPEKGLGLVFAPHFMYDFYEKCFSCYILVTDQMSLPNYLYFSRYWAIRVLQFVCLVLFMFSDNEILELITFIRHDFYKEHKRTNKISGGTTKCQEKNTSIFYLHRIPRCMKYFRM